MTVERDIAGFALPFAAGVAAAVYAGTAYSNAFMPMMALAGTAVPLIVLMMSAGRRWNPSVIKAIMAALAIGTGVLAGRRQQRQHSGHTRMQERSARLRDSERQWQKRPTGSRSSTAAPMHS